MRCAAPLTFGLQYSPALIALLSNPLPPAFSPPAKLVVFFLKCLDKATKTPTISTIRPLFVLVANGYNRLSLQMSESQSYNFVKRMTGFMTDPGRADMNVFLTYCLATLAHMHLATVSAGGEPKTGEEKKPSAIGEFFQGRKAPNVLSLILNIVNALVSPETKVDWQEKVQIIRMATVIASALRVNGSTKEDAANLRRLLEKTKTQDGSRVVSEVLDFVSALRLIIPQPLLVSTIQELVRKDRKEESASMFLPVVSTGLFAVSCHPF